jgi:hypothetical protein
MGLVGAVAGLVASLALTINFIWVRGIAIARTEDELILNFPFGRKRLPISGLVATVAWRQIMTAGTMSGYSRRPILVEQVSFDRAGATSIPFRTQLLSESAAVIVQRMEARAMCGMAKDR